MAQPKATNHFQRSNQRESVLWRNSTYRDDTKKGYKCRACAHDSCAHWESHHIACNHAVEGRDVSINRAYVENCLWVTPWDLNNEDNLIGLPLKSQYSVSGGRSPVNLPAHNIDHDMYTDDCKKWLKDQVWDTLNDKKVDHEINAMAIEKQLKKCTTTFGSRIKACGIRNGGTLISYQNRFERSWKNKWYKSFSLALMPRKRLPGTKKDLSKLFSRIK